MSSWRCCWVALPLLAVALAGCNSESSRAAVCGQVTVNGEPLAAGRILFLPLAPNVGPAASAGIVNGTYRLPPEEGPVLGANRVEVEAELALGFPLDDEQAYAKRGHKSLPPQSIPSRYYRESQVVTQIVRGQNQFDLAIEGGPATRGR